MFKTYFFLNFGSSAKETSIFFFLWSTLYRVLSMCKVSWFLIVNFTLSVVIQTLRVKRFYSQSRTCSAKEATILIGRPEKYPECWLIFICNCLQGFLMQNILIVKILGVLPRKHQYSSVLETTCPYSLQSDKYHKCCLIDLYL